MRAFRRAAAIVEIELSIRRSYPRVTQPYKWVAARWTSSKWSAGLKSLSDRAGARVHVPNFIRYASAPGYLTVDQWKTSGSKACEVPPGRLYPRRINPHVRSTQPPNLPEKFDA